MRAGQQQCSGPALDCPALDPGLPFSPEPWRLECWADWARADAAGSWTSQAGAGPAGSMAEAGHPLGSTGRRPPSAVNDHVAVLKAEGAQGAVIFPRGAAPL